MWVGLFWCKSYFSLTAQDQGESGFWEGAKAGGMRETHTLIEYSALVAKRGEKEEEKKEDGAC